MLGDKVGRIHMKRQNLDAITGRKMKALRGEKRSQSEDAGDHEGGKRRRKSTTEYD